MKPKADYFDALVTYCFTSEISQRNSRLSKYLRTQVLAQSGCLRVEAPDGLTHEIKCIYQNHFSEANIKVFDTTISRSVRLGEAQMIGVPAVIHFRKDEAVQDYRRLTEEVFKVPWRWANGHFRFFETRVAI